MKLNFLHLAYWFFVCFGAFSCIIMVGALLWFIIWSSKNPGWPL